MPRPKNEIPTHKHTLSLRTGDYAKMAALFPDLGGGPAIRELVSRFVDKHYPKEESTNE